MSDTTHVHIAVFIVAVFISVVAGIVIGLLCRGSQAQRLHFELEQQEYTTFVLFQSLIQETGRNARQATTIEDLRAILRDLMPSHYHSTPTEWDAHIDTCLQMMQAER